MCWGEELSEKFTHTTVDKKQSVTRLLTSEKVARESRNTISSREHSLHTANIAISDA